MGGPFLWHRAPGSSPRAGSCLNMEKVVSSRSKNQTVLCSANGASERPLRRCRRAHIRSAVRLLVSDIDLVPGRPGFGVGSLDLLG